MTALVFVDVETTGLEAYHHDVWEVALIVRGHRDPQNDGEWLWQLRPNLAKADPNALRISRYYERSTLTRGGHAAHELASPRWGWASDPLEHRPERKEDRSRAYVAEQIATLTDGAHLVGACPWFDERFLQRLLREHGQCAANHYHLIDVEALAIGALSVRADWVYSTSNGDAQTVDRAQELKDLCAPPWKSDDLSAALGVEPASDADRHTALGDARWAQRLYDAIVGGADRDA